MTLWLPLAKNRLATFVSVYSPSLDSSDEVKDRFYDTLYSTLRRISRDDKIILLGEFNARVGRNHGIWHGVIGHHGVGNMNSHLTMNAHISNIARTCYFELRRLASIRGFMTSTATATLVSAFVLSRIDYCSSMLFGSTHDVTSHLQRIQNYAARVILRLPKSSSITIHLKSLHWLPVKVRSTYKIACLCYHCHSNTAP